MNVDDVWTCTIPGRPISKGNSSQRKMRGRIVKQEPSEQAKKHERFVRDYAAAMWRRPPLEGPVRVDATFVFRIPKTGPNRHKKPGEPYTLRPDRSNLIKLLDDALEGVVYLNDQQVCRGEPLRVWGERDETRVVVSAL